MPWLFDGKQYLRKSYEHHDLEEAENFYGSIRKVRHEMKNHMANIKGLAGAGQYGEMEDYVRRMDETMQELEYKYVTGNAVTDVIINDKLYVENSFDGAVPISKGSPLPPTTKQSILPGIIMEHRIGLENVRDVAERYFGGVNIKVKGDVFHVTVMLQ